jgi:hypothetical protein
MIGDVVFLSDEEAGVGKVNECQKCGDPNGVCYRQRTAYHDDRQNFVTLCPECRAENDDHWDTMWSEYYSGLL